MAGEDARLKAGMKAAEDELNLIKNQIQQTLLDIREHILDVTNPFNDVSSAMLDDDEQVNIEEDGVGSAGLADAGGGGDSGPGEEAAEADGLDDDLLGGDSDAFDEEDMIEGDALGDEYEDISGGGFGGGGGGGRGGGVSDLLGPGDELEELPEDDFELDEESELPDGLPVGLTGVGPEEEDSLMPDSEDQSPDAAYEDTASRDAVGDAVVAALGADVDLLTLASLVRWVAITRDRLGANRLDILLDAYEMAGRISPQMKNVIKTLSSLGDEDGEGIPVRDVVTAMVRMEGVLSSGQPRESNRLLGLLLEMDDDPLDRLVA